jgi:hypothetical protein
MASSGHQPEREEARTAITDPIEGLESGCTAANASAETNAAHAGVMRRCSAK